MRSDGEGESQWNDEEEEVGWILLQGQTGNITLLRDVWMSVWEWGSESSSFFFKTSFLFHPYLSPSSSSLRKAPEKQSEVFISPEGSANTRLCCCLMLKPKWLKMVMNTLRGAVSALCHVRSTSRLLISRQIRKELMANVWWQEYREKHCYVNLHTPHIISHYIFSCYYQAMKLV